MINGKALNCENKVLEILKNRNMNIEKEKIIAIKMNKDKRSKILLRTLHKVCDRYLDIGEFIPGIFREGRCIPSPSIFYFDLLFCAAVFIVIYGFLCSAARNQKLKMI